MNIIEDLGLTPKSKKKAVEADSFNLDEGDMPDVSSALNLQQSNNNNNNQADDEATEILGRRSQLGK